MTFCTKYHCNPSNSCWDKPKYVNHGDTRGKVKGSPKVIRIYRLGNMNASANFHVSLDQRGGQNDQHCHH